VGITLCQGQLREDDSTFPCYQMERFTGLVQGSLSTSCDRGGVKPSTVWRQGILTAGSFLPLSPLTGSANSANQLIEDFQTK